MRMRTLPASAERELGFDLTGVEGVAALKQRLARRAATDASPWIVGANWIESKWKPAVFPSRQDLDAVVADRPVVLQRIDGHAVVVNTKALEAAGITRETPDPPGGQILRDPATGEATGMLVDNAMDLVWKRLPPETDESLAQNLEAGAARYVQLGWTEMQEAGADWRTVEQLCRLYAAGRLKLRVYVAIGGSGEDAEKLLAAGRDYRSCDPRLTVRAIKLYMDGALGSRGAALDAPYSDVPGSRGLYVTEPEEILRIAIAGLRRGIQVETHAIGDRGNRVVLDMYEKAFAAVPAAERPVADPRFRIEHAQVVADADIPRFAKLGVIASMQTSHAISDMLFAPARLGTGAHRRRLCLAQVPRCRRHDCGRYGRAGRGGRPARRVLRRHHAPDARGLRGPGLGARPAPHARGSVRDPDPELGLRGVPGAGPRHDRARQARGLQRVLGRLDEDSGSGDPALRRP